MQDVRLSVPRSDEQKLLDILHLLADSDGIVVSPHCRSIPRLLGKSKTDIVAELVILVTIFEALEFLPAPLKGLRILKHEIP